MSQSKVLATRFKQKDYTHSVINKETEKVRATERNTIVADKAVQLADAVNTSQFRMVVDYSIQHKRFEKIVAKYWPILKYDYILGPHLPIHPEFIYSEAPSLRDSLAPGVIDPPRILENKRFSFLSGFYACGRCATCKHAINNVKKRKSV